MSGAAPLAATGPPAGWPDIAMVAGETSGDLLAGLLLDGMRSRWPGMVAAGIGAVGPLCATGRSGYTSAMIEQPRSQTVLESPSR